MKFFRRIKTFLIVLLIVLVLCGAAFFTYRYLLEAYEVKNVYVEGNIHYTDEEIENLVMTGRYGTNSLFLSYKYKGKEIGDIPFIETINVSVEGKDTIRISVYEKAIAGYIEYLGRNIYFDKDGIVVESSEVKTKGVPEVVGVDFDYIILHEPLPAKDSDLFSKVLDITQLMTKYSVDVEKIYFTHSGNIVLYYKDIAINLGNENNLDIKIMNIPSLLKNLDGKKGTLRMENYDETTKRVTFENDSE